MEQSTYNEIMEEAMKDPYPCTKKIIQIATLATEQEQDLYALTEDGKVYIRAFNQKKEGERVKCYWKEIPEEELY